MENKREVFISHHTDSSKDAVLKVCAALESAGISCWYAPRDVKDNFAGSIMRAIRECKVFLLLLNEHSNLSEHVLNEVNFAFNRFKNHEDIVLLPFKIGDCELSDDIYYYLGRFHVMDGSLPPELLRIQELVNRICHLTGKTPERSVTIQEPVWNRTAEMTESAPSAQTYRITGKIVYPNNRFVGRQRELEQIHAAMTGGDNKLFLVGMGGIGKSEIAKMYLKRHADRYDVILWLTFDGTLERTITNDSLFPIQGLRHSDYPEDSVRDYFERKLRILKEISDSRVLIVVDNFDVTEDPDLEEFCGGSYSVLFTTRYHQSADCYPEVGIEGMRDEEDLLGLFRAEYTRALDAAAMTHVRQILRQLDGHPLSIRLVASAMQNRRISPEKMVQLLQSGMSGMTKVNGKAADMIFGRLKRVFQISTLSDEERHILMNLALIPLRGITVEMFYEWCELDDFDVIDDLVRKSWVVHNSVTDEVHLHPLVKDLMLEKLARHPECCTKLVSAITEACRITFYASWERKLMLNDYASAVYERLPREHPNWVMALDCKARLNIDMARFQESAEMFRELAEQAVTLEKKLEYSYKQAQALVLCSESAQAYAVAKAGSALFDGMELDQLSRSEGYFYNELIVRLSEACRQLGRHAEAIEYARYALSFAERFCYATPQNARGWVEYHLGRAYFHDGQLDEAERVTRHAISQFEEVDDVWSACYCYDSLGQILSGKGFWEEALELNARANQTLLHYFAEDHRDVAKNLEWKGNIYADMGDMAHANACYRRAAELYLKHMCVKMAENVRGKIR